MDKFEADHVIAHYNLSVDHQYSFNDRRDDITALQQIRSSTPVAKEELGAYQHGTIVDPRDLKNCQLSEEMRGYLVGPMPPRDFLDKFLPVASFEPDGNKSRWDNVTKKGKDGKEAAMYGPFVNLASYVLHLIEQLRNVADRRCEGSS
jgi:hypothetical protein